MGLHLQLGDLGTWSGGLATAAAVIVAWKLGNKESATNAIQRKRHQAESVAAWVAADRKPLPIKIANRSGDPVYDLVVSLVLVQGAGPQEGRDSTQRRLYKVLPPGTFKIDFEHPGEGMHSKLGVEVSFTDKSGRHWVKDKNGSLLEIDVAPTDYYGYSKPISWLFLDDDQPH